MQFAIDKMIPQSRWLEIFLIKICFEIGWFIKICRTFHSLTTALIKSPSLKTLSLGLNRDFYSAEMIYCSENVISAL